jgi:hypothetical protein
MNAKEKTLEPPPKEKITRDDIEAKLKELRGGIDTQVDDVKAPAAGIAVALAVAIVVVAYWLGRRRGAKRQTVLEIRRI